MVKIGTILANKVKDYDKKTLVIIGFLLYFLNKFHALQGTPENPAYNLLAF